MEVCNDSILYLAHRKLAQVAVMRVADNRGCNEGMGDKTTNLRVGQNSRSSKGDKIADL